MKKLYKSKKDKVLSGLIGGLGEYFDIDPVLLRLAFVVVTFITGFFPGVIAYIIGVLIAPNSPSELSKMVKEMKVETKKEEKVEEKPQEKNEPKKDFFQTEKKNNEQIVEPSIYRAEKPEQNLKENREKPFIDSIDDAETNEI
jgi:phage shock protein C